MKWRVERDPSVSWLPYFRFVPGRLDDLHFGPVGFKFVGDDQRHACAHALPHLGAVADDGDGAVGRNRHEGERIVHGAVRHAGGAPFGGIGGQRRTPR